VQPHLSPAAVAELEPEVVRIIDEQLALVLDAGRLDIVAAFSDMVPARTVCALLGLPPEDSAKVIAFTLGTGALLDGVTTLDGMGDAATSAIELAVHMHERMDEMLARAPEERRGMLGVFADQLDAGEVDRGEVSAMLTVFVTAGSETTASLMATCIETLAREPQLQGRLRAEPALIPNAIERILRDSGPFQFHYRYTPEDTTLGGVAIPAHSRVLLMWAAANRPAPGVEDTDEFDLEAKPMPHFAFGRGLHFCIGAPVARMETRLALERLLAATTSIELDPESAPTRRPSIFIRRHATLPVIVESA
jgi:cytochrome P450